MLSLTLSLKELLFSVAPYVIGNRRICGLQY